MECVCYAHLGDYFSFRFVSEQKFLDAGALGVIIRAGSSDGTPYMDYEFENHAQKFNDEIPCGYYWYFRPEFNPSSQATYFVNLMKSVRTDIFPVVDVESNFQKVSMGTFQNNLYEFISITEDLMAMDSVIYTRGSFWNNNVGNPAWARTRRLHIAMYNDEVSHPWKDPASWTDFWMWQYSADKPPNNRGAEFGVPPEGTDSIDINRYNGTLEEFYADANWNQEKPPTKPWCGIIQKIKGLCEKYLREYC
jgi:GH25 family lysozyme M1 (1,4-beta-N-acetylmuramidase)